MSRLNDLLRRLNHSDPALAADLKREVDALADRRAFGLNFERHAPEAVELPGRKINKGDKVRILPQRGSNRTTETDRLWRVLSVNRTSDLVTVSLEAVEGEDTRIVPQCDLVVVAEFRDPIYPGLVSTGKVERGGTKPFHTVINAENFHALQTLLFTHRSKVDCIYIDPPYNTGAKDWKYNNDYVESDDLYRHSKWLAFMERRLEIARELMNPEGSVLIVTIDEKEVHRLGLLLQDIFPDCKTQLVTIVIQAAGSNRRNELGRVEEYAIFVFMGNAAPVAARDDLLNDAPSTSAEKVRWESLLRSGTGSARTDSPRLFFPIFVARESGFLVGCGDSKELATERTEWDVPDGCFAVWPIKKDGQEGRWRCAPATLRQYLAGGYAKAGACDPETGRGTIWYLGRSARDKLATGEFSDAGHEPSGAIIAKVVEAKNKTFPVKTVWNRARHHAGWHGTNLIGMFLPGRKFPFPKSLYAVEDALRVAVGDKPEAVVLDFFAGSGTTAHALMRLNKQDNGRRQCISVTNNEVSADEQKSLRAKGLRPGDREWEQWGICDYITKPRIEAAIAGQTPQCQPISGDYKFTDEFPMSEGFRENAEFFTLTYESPLRVSSNREFAKIAPLLWMRAGSRGRRIDDVSAGWDVAETYGVIADLNQTEVFLKEVTSNEGVGLVYIVTDEDRLFESVVRELPEHVEPVRLYEAYLRNFEIETGRNSQ